MGTTRGRGRRSSLPFFKNLKRAPSFLEKNTMIVANYGLNFSFKIQFLTVSRRKKPNIFFVGPFFLVLYMKCLSQSFNSKKTTLP